MDNPTMPFAALILAALILVALNCLTVLEGVLGAPERGAQRPKRNSALAVAIGYDNYPWPSFDFLAQQGVESLAARWGVARAQYEVRPSLKDEQV